MRFTAAVTTKKMPNKLCCVCSARSPQENVDYTEVFSAFPTNCRAGAALALVVMAGTAVEMIANDKKSYKTRLKIDSSFSRKWNLEMLPWVYGVLLQSLGFRRLK